MCQKGAAHQSVPFLDCRFLVIEEFPLFLNRGIAGIDGVLNVIQRRHRLMTRSQLCPFPHDLNDAGRISCVQLALQAFMFRFQFIERNPLVFHFRKRRTGNHECS